MRRVFSHFAAVFLFCVVGAGLAVAQCPTPLPNGNNFCLSGVGNGNSLYGIYVSPYQALINGSGVPTYVICDDFEDEVILNESWTTTSYSVTGAATNGLFGNTSVPTTTQYEEAAYLSGLLIGNLSNPNPQMQDLLSYSIWAVFDPGTAPTSGNSGTGVQGWIDSHYIPGQLTYAAVQQELSVAAANASSSNYSNVTVYTPTNGSENPGIGRPQEFLVVSTPEAPATANIAVDLLALGGLLFVFRKRFATL
jgi:hypothetical protein